MAVNGASTNTIFIISTGTAVPLVTRQRSQLFLKPVVLCVIIPQRNVIKRIFLVRWVICYLAD
jgi:hypothetical protein